MALSDDALIDAGPADDPTAKLTSSSLGLRFDVGPPAADSAWLTDVRRSYLDQAAIGYLIYMVGAVTAFLAAVLMLSDGQAGLHSSAMAIGMIGASLAGHRLDDRLGIRAVHLSALGILALAALLMAWAPAFAATLLAAAGFGLGCGLLLVHVNSATTVSGGVRALMQLTRSTLVSMVASVTVPVVIGLGIAIGLGWQSVVVPAVLLIGIAAVATRGRADRPQGSSASGGRLPRAFWLPWLLIVLVVCVEFGILFWASTMVERSTGASLADATLTISVFIGGVILARAAVSSPAVGSIEPVWLLRGGLVLALVGSLLLWATSSYEISIVAMLIGGAGVGVLYPVSASVTLATTSGQAALASSRVVLGSGIAILVAPFALGVLADMMGVVSAWLLLPLICLASMLLTVPLGAARGRRPSVGYPTDG